MSLRQQGIWEKVGRPHFTQTIIGASLSEPHQTSCLPSHWRPSWTVVEVVGPIFDLVWSPLICLRSALRLHRYAPAFLCYFPERWSYQPACHFTKCLPASCLIPRMHGQLAWVGQDARTGQPRWHALFKNPPPFRVHSEMFARGCGHA